MSYFKRVSQDVLNLIKTFYASIKRYYATNLRWKSRTTYKNPFHRAHAIVILLLLLPIASFIAYESYLQDATNTFSGFFVGIFSGAFVLGFTILIANFLIFEPIKSWQSDRDVAVGLSFAKSTLREYIRGLETEVIRVCDWQEKSFKDRRGAVDLSGGIHTTGEALDLVISSGECEKAFQKMGLLSNQRHEGQPRIYKGLITEVQSLKNVVAVLPSLLKPLNVFGEAALNSYAFIVRSQKNVDSIVLEIENAEKFLYEDKLCDQSDKDMLRQLLNTRVRQLYAEVFQLHGHLTHIARLSESANEQMQDRYSWFL